MYKKNQIIEYYNEISDDKLNNENIVTILPKLYLILNKRNLDQIELIEIIDILKEFKNYNKLDNITSETIDLVKKITGKEFLDYDGTLCFPMVLKHLLLPYNMDKCDNNYNLMLFLSEFEIFIEIINKSFSQKELTLLGQYNSELKELIVKYKECRKIYDKYVKKDVILSEMNSHFATMLYFNLEEFNYDYDLIVEIMYNIIDRYNDFINNCCALGIHKNFTRVCEDIRNIEYEYIVSYNMLKYLYDNKKKKIKRK